MLAGVAVAAEPSTLTGKAVSVHDDDVLHVANAGGVNHAMRLQGIYAPETKQPFGTKSRNRLTALVKGKTVEPAGVYPLSPVWVWTTPSAVVD